MNPPSKMSGILHRSQSHMDGNKSFDREEAVGDVEGKLQGVNGHSPTNATQNGAGTQSSPLRVFTIAKKRVNEIFQELDGHVKESTTFLKKLSEDVAVPVDLDMVDQVEKQYSKIKGISEIISRDHMKVVFFGRTSNGKSTVINAMLRDKILPSGIGHTTNCFIQVEGTNQAEGYAMKEGSTEHFGVTSVASLSHALSRDHLDEDSLVRLMWPKSKCLLLRDDVVLVDSPGIDVTEDTDSWINKYCMDADVFVLVANSESTLMQTEKRFFHKVSERLSKPNVFILQNRWDQSAIDEQFPEEVRRQHLDRNIDFLTNELKVLSKEEAAERVYFISAREVLLTHMRKQNSTGTPTPDKFQEGYHMRMQDFETFEWKFQQCLSNSAVRTKFEHHVQQGKNIAQGMHTLLESVYDKANDLRINQEDERLRQESLFLLKTTHYENLTLEFKEKMDALTRKAGQEVIVGFKEEFARLSTTVNLYNRNWPITNEQMDIYKAGLYEVFERNLLRNFEARCSVPISNAVDLLQQEMLNRLGGLLPEQVRDVKLAPLHRRQRFLLKLHLGIPEICGGFREDLTFQFSLGWQRVARILLSRNELRRLATFGFLPMPRRESDVPTPVTSKAGEANVATLSQPQTSSSTQQADASPRNLDMVEIAAILSKCGVGSGAVLFLVWRSIGWKVIGAAAATYGVLYGAERLAWHFRTRRRVFKNQFVEFVKPQLATLIHPTAKSCSHQVHEELEETYNELIHMVSGSTTELSERISELRKQVKSLDDVTSQTKVMKSKSVWLESQLQSFWDTYIAPSSKEQDGTDDMHRPSRPLI